MNRILENHPNPQFARKDIEYLAGDWQISIDGGALKDINVPYCVESKYSGIRYKDFIKECVYKRSIFIDESKLSQNVYLNFGAVNYRSVLSVNGKFVGEHEGGHTPFSFLINDYIAAGENEISLTVRNDLTERNPSGKQSPKLNSFGCFYTRSTGIWQDVWLEFVPKNHVKKFRFYPDTENCRVKIEVECVGRDEFFAEAFLDDTSVGQVSATVDHIGSFYLPLSQKLLWEVGKGGLYECVLKFGDDTVYTYFGLREVRYDGYKFLVNGKSVFQRLVLDQGYYKNGVYTPNGVGDYANDVDLAMSLGFNGARLHQKVFSPLYLFECDRRGFMVWGEFPSWGVDYYNLNKLGVFLDEWKDVVQRDFNHPSIVTWCPLNETWGELDNSAKSRDLRFIDSVYAVTKALDKTRPCVDVSGGMHGSKTDVFDYHCYDGFEELKRRMDRAMNGDLEFMCLTKEGEGIGYNNEPQNLSEFGGVSFGGGTTKITECVTNEDAWGYTSIADEVAFVENYEKTVKYLLSLDKLSGFCYTQLYDVEQEQNGLYTYSRKPKFSSQNMERIRFANLEIAEIEK